MASYAHLAKRLQCAINQRTGDGAKLLINTSQWYSKDKGRTITSYVIKQSVTDGDKAYRHNIEMFHTYSQVQMVLWLRDYWYELNGWEVPTDNDTWEVLKQQYGRTGEASEVEPTKTKAST
jgi:hypothetical protein